MFAKFVFLSANGLLQKFWIHDLMLAYHIMFTGKRSGGCILHSHDGIYLGTIFFFMFLGPIVRNIFGKASASFFSQNPVEIYTKTNAVV